MMPISLALTHGRLLLLASFFPLLSPRLDHSEEHCLELEPLRGAGRTATASDTQEGWKWQQVRRAIIFVKVQKKLGSGREQEERK